MTTIVTRVGKGSPLTWTEVDSNFTNLNNAKYESGNNVTFGTIGGTTITASSGFSGALNGTVGATTPASGAFTTLSASSTVSGTGFSTYLASPPAIGGTAPAAGTFTSGSFTSITDSGNLTFTGTGNRITGDFNNATAANRVAFQNSTTNAQTILTIIPNGTSVASALAIEGDSAVANGPNATYNLTSTDVRLTSGGRGTFTYLPMTFYTGGSERMRINTSGNVGIGTSSPAEILHVNGGDIRIQQAVPELKFVSEGAVNRWYVGANISDSVDGGLCFGNGTGVGNNERMRIDSSGNVGIGTSSPAAELEIKGTGFVATQISGDSTNETQLRFATNTAARVSQQSNQALIFDTNATERMRIHSSGGVSIGNTTDPGATNLNVTGSINGGYSALADGTTAMGFGSANVVRVTPNATATYTTTVPRAGSICVLSILTSGTTSYTITFGTGFKTTGTLATGATSARYFQISFVSDGTNLLETGRTAAIA